MSGNNITAICERFRAKLRHLIVITGAARIATVGLVALSVCLAADWAFHFPWGWRVLPLAALLSGLGALTYWTILTPLRQRWTDAQVLNYIDSSAEYGEDMLLDLYELERGHEIQERQDLAGAKLADEAIAMLAPISERSHHDAALNRGYPNRWAGACLSATALFLIGALLLPEHAAIGLTRFFNPFSTERWPHRTTIALDEPATRWKIPQGEAFCVSARVTGIEIPTQVVLEYLSEDLGFWMEERLTVNPDGRIRHTFPQVNDALQFQLRGGDYVTDRFSVQLTLRPKLSKIAARYDFPVYAGLPIRTVESGQLAGLEGTKVKLDFTASMPLKRAVFVLEGKAEEELKLNSPMVFSKTIVLEKNGRYEIQLFDLDGFREPKPEMYEIHVTPDEPPSVELLSPGRDLDATARATIAVDFRAKDDFGLKQVEFYYSMDGSMPKPLTDRITGPLDAQGKDFATHFSWDLARSEWPNADRVTVEYFARVTDVNPTDRGIVESPHRKINLLKPSVYREQLFQEAGALLNEALLAERSQREAYFATKKWIDGKASGKEDDPLWAEILQKQDNAIRAARAMEKHLMNLAEQYEMNRIAFEFMSGRLAAAGQNLREVFDRHHPAIVAALSKARPRSAADAAPAVLRKTRTESLNSVHDVPAGQKMAVLLFQRILYQLYDWRDLQGAAITALRIAERQEEISSITAQIAPKYLGKNILDLADEDQVKLKSIGNQEKALYDAETAIETQLKMLYTKSEAEQRKSFEPLRRAFADLRAKRVNDNLSRASIAIENNQAADILELQKNAAAAVRAVTTGLETAGQLVEKLPPLTLAMQVRKTDPDKIELAKKPEGSPDEAATTEITEGPAFRSDALSSDPLTAALLECADLLEMVLKRTRYLNANMGNSEMPRFVSLKLGMVEERHEQAVAAIRKAADEAAKQKNEAVQHRLADLQTEIAPLLGVVRAQEVGPRVQQILANGIETCRDLTHYNSRQKAVAGLKAEHDHQGGIDAFKRLYVLRDKDLTLAVEVIGVFDVVRLQTRDVARKLQRFGKDLPAAGSAALKLEETRRIPAAELMAKSALQKDKIVKTIEQFSPSVRHSLAAKCNEALSGEWAKYGAAIQAGKNDEALGDELTQLGEKMLAAIDGLRDLADACGEAPRPPEDETKPKEPPPQAVAQMTQEEYEKLQSPDALSERLQKNAVLPARTRESLMRSLKQPMPTKYKPLLTAFVNACLDTGSNAKEPAQLEKDGKPKEATK